MQKHTYMPEGILHNKPSPEFLQIVYTKIETSPHITIKTDTHVGNTNKASKDNQYPWLDKNDKKMKNVKIGKS